MRYPCFLVLLFSLSTVALAQTPDAGLKKAQNNLKKLLINDTPLISSVKFDGCKMSVRSGTFANWSDGPGSSEADRTGYFQDQARFSAGPGSFVREGRSDHYVIDLSLFDKSVISVLPSHKRSLSVLQIANSPEGLVTGPKPDPMSARFAGGAYRFTVKAKSTKKVLDAFDDLLAVCAK